MKLLHNSEGLSESIYVSFPENT